MRHSKLALKAVLRSSRKTVISIIFFYLISNIHCDSTKTEGWITYRHDNARSGATRASLTTPLSLRWTIHPTHSPKPAWPEPGEEMERTHFDNVYHVTAVKGKVFFGSSVDNKVYAVNAKTGKTHWTFFTEGPVRYAPTVWKNRVFVGSDDGYVYCLKINDGKLIWKVRAGPSDEKVLGNGRMISLWPVRTSILVDNGIIYFGAGVFPYEGIYICALKASDGRIIWKNDTIGDRAHELAYGGISPQSYLIASKNVLYVPSGRAMPAAFDKKTGEFLYYCLPGGKVGGTWSILDRDKLIAGVDWSGTPAKVTYDEKTGGKKDDVHAWFPGIDLVVTPDVTYTLTEQGIFAMDRTKYQTALEKVNDLNEERQKLRSRLQDLDKKQKESTEDRRDELNKQREEISQKINELGEEEKRQKGSVRRWEYPIQNMNSLILAGDKVFAGGEGIVVALDARTGNELWKSGVKGKACGLAATNRNLFISTDNGNIYCFKEGEISGSEDIKIPINTSPYKNDELTPIYESAAAKIVEKTGIEKGYCLVLDCGTGRLALELAKKTDLKILGIEEDPEKVAEAKNKLDAAGLYGSRVVIERWDLSTFPDYFANLIVSDGMMISGEIKDSPEGIFRVLKPCGGIAYFGQPEEIAKHGKSLDLQNLLTWMRNVGASEPDVFNENGVWAKVTRGSLEGAGSWTEQYGNPQNTACSGDQLVKGPLGILWYGEPGSEKILDRHSKAVSPVSIDGRLFIQGEEVIMAYDAYNGTPLWEKEIAGAVRARADIDGGNLSVTEDGLYVAAHDKCYRLNPVTGETMHVFTSPSTIDGSARRWTYVSYSNNILFGSRGKPLIRDYFALVNSLIENGEWKDDTTTIPPQYMDHYENLRATYPVPDERLLKDFKRSGVLWRLMADFPVWELYKPSKGAVTQNMMTSDMIFAMNPKTGNLLWKYPGRRMAHITIANGNGKIFFAECTITDKQKKQAISEKLKLIQQGKYEERPEGEINTDDIDARMVVALDAATGKKLWEKPLDLTGCGGDGAAAAYHDGVLLFFGNTGTHDAWRFQNSSLGWRRLTALSAKNGEVLWSRPLNYNARPVIVGNQIFIEPRACDLHTGEIKMRSHPITGNQVPFEYLRPGHTCAITSASANMLFYRSSSTAIYDFEKDRGLTLFGGIRPGCWINMIPASGVLLFPEGSSGCTCSFPLRCSVVFKHKKKRSQPYTVFIAHGATTPVKHFAINLGAPADMMDDEGKVWFGYPNPKTDYLQNHYPNYGVKFDLHDKVLPGMGYFCSDFKGMTIEGSNKPYLFTTGCVGLTRCEIPLIDDTFGEKPGVYTVRLGFSAPLNDHVNQRVFDVLIQGNPVLKNLDIVGEAGSSNIAIIKEFNKIEVENILILEFTTKKTNPTIAEAPIINFIQVIREDTAPKSESPESITPITMSDAEALLKVAQANLGRRYIDKALENYHTVLDAAPSVNQKLKALQGMATIASPKSLRRIARYCRDDSPILIEESRRNVLRPNTRNSILWNYKDPDPELIDSAARVYTAIANNTTKNDKHKAIGMLNRALSFTRGDIREEVVNSLRELGVEIP